MKTLVIDLKSQLIFLPEDVERIKSSIDIDYHIYAILLSHKYYIKDGMYEQKKEGIPVPGIHPLSLHLVQLHEQRESPLIPPVR